MDEQMSWHIGKEGAGNERIDQPPHKAYFYWKKDGKIIDSAEYTEQELVEELERRRSTGQPLADFEEALRRLRLY